MTSYHEAQRQKGFALQKMRKAVSALKSFCERSEKAAGNIQSALDEFVKVDKEIREKYERNKTDV